MSRLSNFQLTLLTVWGASAIAALGGSFWLTGTDWSKMAKAGAMAQSEQPMGRIIAEPPQRYKQEALALRESVQVLERRNRILASRLDALESDLGTITASIPNNSQSRIVPLDELPSQSMPTALSKPLNNNNSTPSQKTVRTNTQPFPLKVPGTNRAPSDAEIGEALLAQ